jgi:Poly A polymerase head domain
MQSDPMPSGKKLLSSSGNLVGRIELKETERVILGELLRVNEACEMGITFRVVGGWVRDKLLGRFSNDLDIALSRDTPLSPSGLGAGNDGSGLLSAAAGEVEPMDDSCGNAERGGDEHEVENRQQQRAREEELGSGESRPPTCAGEDAYVVRGEAALRIRSETVDVEEFCAQLNAHRERCGEKPHRVAMVRPNPALHKYTLVATLQMAGLPVDLLSLREGGLLPDAQRRDATLNALYYNANTNMVEDPTGLGLDDLKQVCACVRVRACPCLSLRQ